MTKKLGKNELIAHWREKDQQAQLLMEHLHKTSVLADGFTAKVGLSEAGKILGLVHNLGKASQEYQDYLLTKEGLISPDEDGYSPARRDEIDHSTAGAQLIFQKLANQANWEGRSWFAR